jgi:hypothetical protein
LVGIEGRREREEQAVKITKVMGRALGYNADQYKRVVANVRYWSTAIS